MEVHIHGRRGLLELARGRPAEALQWFDRARAGLEERQSTNPAESSWLVDRGVALVAVGQRQEG